MTTPAGSSPAPTLSELSPRTATTSPVDSRPAPSPTPTPRSCTTSSTPTTTPATWSPPGLGRTTVTNTYDERGQLGSSTDAEGNTTTYSYDHAGRTASVTSPRGNQIGATPENFTTSYGYDELGRRYAVAQPFTSEFGPTLGYSYTGFDENNRPIATLSAAGRTTTTAFDESGNPLTIEDGEGRVGTRSYDDTDRLTATARPGEDPTTYTYDDDGLRLTQTSPSGDSTRSWTYDDDGRVLTQVSPRGNAPLADPQDFTTSYEYDAEGHTTSVTDPLGHQTTTTYDPLGNALTSTDPRGKSMTWSYDAASRITSVTPPGGAEPTTYDYDTFGDLTSRTDALGHVTTYTYTDLHQVTSVTDPLDRTKTLDYDADGNLVTTVTARGNALGADPEAWTMTRDVDASGRLMSRTTADSADSASYSYDADGLITGYADAHGTTAQAFNGAGQLSEVIQPDETTYGYTYNATGDIEARTYPNGDTTSYTYNDDGQVETQTTDSQTTSYTYNPDQQLTQIAYPATTDIVESRDYDPAGQISDITTLDTSGPTVIDEYTFLRDANGNPTRITQTVGVTATPRAFSYDDRNWLTTECPGVTTCTGATDYVAYGYDDVGNRLQMNRVGTVPNPGTTDYTYDDADQLSQADDGTLTNYTYDADGNLTSGGRTWNALNQMTGSHITGSSASTFSYDALGNRISSTTGSDTTALSWDINNPLPMLAVETSTADEQVGYSYTPAGDLLQTQHPDDAYPRSFHTTDALGSVTDSFKADGTPTVQTVYDAYGTATVTPLIVDAVDPDLGYTGAYLEQTTDEDQLRARGLDTSTGRFSSTDPVQQGAGVAVSAYTYVLNRPTVLTDPSGLMPASACQTEVCPGPIGYPVYDPLSAWAQSVQDFAQYVQQAAENALALVGQGIGVVQDIALTMVITCIQTVGSQAIDLAIGQHGEGVKWPGPTANNAWEDALEEAGEKVPAEWGQGEPNAKGEGKRWHDPDEKGNGVRVDKGDPNNPNPSQQVDHVNVHSGGKTLGPDGKPLTSPKPSKDPASHIPLSDWLRWTSWNSP